MNKIAIAALVAVLMSTTVAVGRPASRSVAASHFDALSLNERYELQMNLIAAGFSGAVSTDDMSTRLFDAICRFQAAIGAEETGFLTKQQSVSLKEMALVTFGHWQLESVSHPDAPTRIIWVPRGVLNEQTKTKTGYTFDDREGHLKIDFNFLPNQRLEPTLESVVAARAKSEMVIDYQVQRTDFIAVHSHLGSVRSYTRYQEVQGGLVGFAAYWDEGDGQLAGDRLVTVMSDLLRANVGLAIDRRPPSFSSPSPLAVQATVRNTAAQLSGAEVLDPSVTIPHSSSQGTAASARPGKR